DRAVLFDFGIAQRLGVGRDATARGAMVGTPGYMAPEQARGERCGPRADVFSLGCVLYHCITGKPAFDGEHPLAIAANLLLEEPPPPSHLGVDVAPALESVLLAMLAKDPTGRPADGAAVLAALEPSMIGRQAPTAPPASAGLGPMELSLLSVVLATGSPEAL